MKQTKMTNPTIMLLNTSTAEEFKADIDNVRELIILLLRSAEPTHTIYSEMVGRCFDFLDNVNVLDIVDNWPKNLNTEQ